MKILRNIMLFGVLATHFVLQPLIAESPSFWSWWGDSKAEISVYDVQQARYGEMRKAEQVFVYVTEPMNLKKQVKSDAGFGEVANVLKLNRMKTFNTGIYQYNTMTSTFMLLEDAQAQQWRASKGTVAKVTMTMQEWCGTSFEQMNRVSNGYRVQERSYFEKEGDRETLLTIPPSAPLMPADGLFILARELVAPLTLPKLALVRSAEYTRMQHVAPDVFEVVVNPKAEIPDWYEHSFEGDVHAVTFSGKVMSYEFVVENAYPRKIVAYRILNRQDVVEQGTLRATMREPYWSQNANKYEELRQKLGLQ